MRCSAGRWWPEAHPSTSVVFVNLGLGWVFGKLQGWAMGSGQSAGLAWVLSALQDPFRGSSTTSRAYPASCKRDGTMNKYMYACRSVGDITQVIACKASRPRSWEMHLTYPYMYLLLLIVQYMALDLRRHA